VATFNITELRLVEAIEQFTGIAGAAISRGQAVRFDANGKLVPAQANNATNAECVGIALKSAQAGTAVTVLRQGVLDVGNALASAAYGAPVYLQDTAGAIGDTAGTVNVRIGQVIAHYTIAGAQKLLRVRI
jgi:predicted RecA/RadA family phage recombinase